MHLSTSLQRAPSVAHEPRPPSPLPWWVPALGATVACVLCAIWLRGLTHRADAGQVWCFIVPWGLVALLALRASRAPIWAVAGLAIGLRAVWVGAPPWLSDDVFRYLAEGTALNEGVNPFLTPPSAVSELPDWLRSRVNHPELTSLYPPVAMLWFRAVTWMGGSIAAFQAATAAVDLLIVAAIWRGAGPRFALAYAIHPIGPLEAALGAHVDILAIALLAWACLWASRRPSLSAALMTLGGGVKGLPAVFIPWLVRGHGWRLAAPGALIGAGVVVLCALPVLDAGPALFATLGTYGRSWSFNGLGHSLLTPLLGDWARLVLFGLGAFVGIWALRNRRTPLAAWSLVGAGFLLLTPTAHPWYALWAVVPSLMLKRWEWLAASTALMASYAVLHTLDDAGGWREPDWLLPVTWGPAVAVLLYATCTRARARPAPR